jgi:hypothetical protein
VPLSAACPGAARGPCSGAALLQPGRGSTVVLNCQPAGPAPLRTRVCTLFPHHFGRDYA